MEKVKNFNDYFLCQCKPINNNSVLPSFYPIAQADLSNITISKNQIRDIIINLNINKAHEISGRMIELCGENITLPLSIIFNNIIKTGIFPDLWKSANVTPVHKKDSKQIMKKLQTYFTSSHFCQNFRKDFICEHT